MIERVRHPGTPPKDIDHGPAAAHLTPYRAMRRPIDEAIVYSAAHQKPNAR